MSAVSAINIVIVGKGFAASMAALALSKQLPDTVNITFVHLPGSAASDCLYGSVSSPEAYKNNLMLDVSEPELFLKTKTAFSFGTQYSNWGSQKLQWMQCFHLPFPADESVHFHHLMTQHKADIADYLISAQAAKLGRFAHPPENPKSALSRAEYGYHFDTQEWSALYLSKLSQHKITVIDADINTVHVQDDNIASIELDTGEHLSASLFVDCSGTDARLLSQLSDEFRIKKWAATQHDVKEVSQTGPSFRAVSEDNSNNHSLRGWQSTTSLQGKNIELKFQHLPSKKNDESVALGERPFAWIGNCVGLGHAACVLEPLTPAPYMLLCLDIKRLLELIPIDDDMSMERKEYNRRYADDICHARLFEEALYSDSTPSTEQNNAGAPQSNVLPYEPNSKLDRKLKQFNHRGVLANYDLEPFNDEDWIILHWGMRRIPKQYDKLADQVGFAQTSAKLANMKKGIAHLASQMPPHHIYIEKFLQFIREQHGNK